jgi:hypothetical protein
MAHYTLIARINAGDGKFPFVNVQFSRNHPPLPIEGATYYLRPGNRGSRTPIGIGKDLNAASAALLKMGDCKALNNVAVLPTVRARPSFPPPYLVRPSLRRLGSTASAAHRNRTRLLLAIALPSICLPKVARRRTSTRFAAMTCWIIDPFCGNACRQRRAGGSGSLLCVHLLSQDNGLT